MKIILTVKQQEGSAVLVFALVVPLLSLGQFRHRVGGIFAQDLAGMQVLSETLAKLNPKLQNYPIPSYHHCWDLAVPHLVGREVRPIASYSGEGGERSQLATQAMSLTS